MNIEMDEWQCALKSWITNVYDTEAGGSALPIDDKKKLIQGGSNLCNKDR